MKLSSRFALAVFSCCTVAGGLGAQSALKPQTLSDFECYVQSAEARAAARKTFLLAESDPAIDTQVVRGRKIHTVAVAGANPRKITGGMLYDWIGTVFLEGATLDRTMRMLQDYGHRPQYFSDVVAESKLLCRTGENRFGYFQRLKEPAVIDSDNDVLWERVDAHRWRCRSYSTKITEVGKQHGYLYRLNSYWRLADNDKGLLIEGQTITLSGEFGSLMRTLGSLAGINPEKSLKKTLAAMRETIEKHTAEFPPPPSGLPDCGEPVTVPACTVPQSR
jgi:hypothetical protein